MSNLSALRLVDRAILPTITLISVKILAIFLGSLLWSVNWEFSFSSSDYNLLFFQFQSKEDLSTLVNFSDTFLVLTTAGVFCWYIFQAKHLNKDKTHPTLIARMFGRMISHLLTNNQELFHNLGVWLALSWLVLFLILLNAYQGLTTSFVLGLSLATTFALSYAFFDIVRNN